MSFVCLLEEGEVEWPYFLHDLLIAKIVLWIHHVGVDGHSCDNLNSSHTCLSQLDMLNAALKTN